MAEIVVKLVNGELAGKTAQSITKELNAAAQAARKATIGTKEWVDAHDRLEKAKELQAGLTKQINSTKAASDLLKAAWNKLPGAQFFNQIASSLGMLRAGVGGLASQFGVLKVAIASTGIGLIIIAVMALIGAFSKFTPIVDKVEQVLSGISAVINELWQRIQQFGIGLFKILTGAPGGVDQLAASFDGLGDSIMNAYDAGVQLKKLQQDLEDAARGIEIANARAEKQVEKLIVMSKNKSRTDREQIDLLKQARKIADENFVRNDKLKADEFEALMLEAETKSDLSRDEIMRLTEGTLAQEIEFEKRGTIEDELLDKIKDAQIERINAEGATGKLLEKIQNAENARIEKQIAEREKRFKAQIEAEKKALKEEQEAKDSIRQLEHEKRIAQMDDEHQKEIEALNFETEEKIVALQGTEAQILEQTKLLREIQQAELDAINKKWSDKKLADQKKSNDEAFALMQESHEREKQINADKVKFQQDMDALRMNSIQDASKFASDIITKDLKNERDAKRVKKTFALVDIGINLQKELSANALTSAANPLNSVTFGAAGAAQLTGLNIASFIRAGISAARVIAFRKGGWLKGPKHEQNGIPAVNTSTGQPLEMEGNEFVFSSKAVDAIGVRALTRLNDRYTRMASGGPVDPFADRGPVSRSGAPRDGSVDAMSLNADVVAEIRALRAEMAQWPLQLEVINVVSKTQKGIDVINRLESRVNV